MFEMVTSHFKGHVIDFTHEDRFTCHGELHSLQKVILLFVVVLSAVGFGEAF